MKLNTVQPFSMLKINRHILGLIVLFIWTSLYTQTSISSDSYLLGAGDMIVIQVYGEDDLTLETRLRDNGKISYPFIGEINISNMSIQGLEDLITKELKGDYLINPRVTVTLQEYRQIYVNGEVKEPGGYEYQPGLTVHKAISLAGGFTDRADRKKILLVKENSPAGLATAVGLNDVVSAGDTLTIDESFF
jgi:polysaccharide export outer membrane protein